MVILNSLKILKYKAKRAWKQLTTLSPSSLRFKGPTEMAGWVQRSFKEGKVAGLD